MLSAAQVLFLSLAVMGVSVTGVAAGDVHMPLSKAIEIHKDHLATNSTMPEQSVKGQQNAYDHLVMNQERWVAKNHTWMPGEDNEIEDMPNVL